MSYPTNTGDAIAFAYPLATLEPGGNCQIVQRQVKVIGAINEIATYETATDILQWDAVAIGKPKPRPADVQTILDSPEFAAHNPQVEDAVKQVDDRVLKGVVRFLYLDLYAWMRKQDPTLPDLTPAQFVNKVKQRIREVSP